MRGSSHRPQTGFRRFDVPTEVDVRFFGAKRTTEISTHTGVMVGADNNYLSATLTANVHGDNIALDDLLSGDSGSLNNGSGIVVFVVAAHDDSR